MTTVTDLNTPALAGETTGTGTTGAPFGDVQVPVTALIPPGSTVLLCWTSGTNTAALAGVTDAVGNVYELATLAQGGRSTAIAVCTATDRELRPGDLLTGSANYLSSGYRLWVWVLPAPSTLRDAESVYATGTAIELPSMNTEPGELIFAVNSVQGNVALVDPSWPVLRQHPNTSPVFRAFAVQADGGPLGFTSGLASSGAWSMCGVRLRVAGTEPPPPEPPPLPDQATLVPVTWNGIDLNPGYRDDGLLVIVTDLTGWYGTPALNGRDLDRAIADGAIFGPKTLGPRLIAIEGAVQGPRGACLDFSRELARLASERGADPFTVGEDGTVLTATVRAGTDQMTHAWSGPNLFRYQVTVTAADPRLYTQDWQTALLQTGAGIDTGREYPREYPWAYGASDIPNSARVTNPGNTDAPVWAAYQGPLGESRLAAGERYIRVAALSDGQQLTVNCETLAAWAPGGAARASYILGGSQPLIPAPRSSDLWRLTATGTGSVRLQWRGAFA